MKTLKTAVNAWQPPETLLYFLDIVNAYMNAFCVVPAMLAEHRGPAELLSSGEPWRTSTAGKDIKVG